MGANTAKEHHLVPKHWLRAFAEDGHLRGRWRSGAEYRTPVRRAAVARHFNTDPLAEGAQRVALESYLDHDVDGPAAPVLRVVREGLWPLEDDRQDTLLDALAWQLVRTRAFRAFDTQVGDHLFPMFWASDAVSYCEEKLGQALSPRERLEVFRAAWGSAPGAAEADPRSALRSSIRAFERVRHFLTAPGRRLVLLECAEPLLVIGDSGVVLRRKDGSHSITPPLLPETVQLFAPLSPCHLLISTTRSHYDARGRLTRRLAAKANAGAAAWCQDAVYRLPSMPWPAHLHLPDAPLQVAQPYLSASPAQSAPALQEPAQIRRPALRALLEQLSSERADAAPTADERHAQDPDVL
ncbi:DUF4238 domain-containing protein [Streptomyces lydicus]|uniref:DUF4238 domain-containing protein n=1 Tax=Streptomyces lydicus TaxID=47763 RepID=UPI00378EEECA